MKTLLALLYLVCSSGLDDPTVILTDGSELQGEVVEISALGLSLKSGASIDLDRVARVRFRAPSTRRDTSEQLRVDLVDGSRIQAAQVTIRDRMVRLVGRAGWTMDLSTNEVESIRLKPLPAASWESEWEQIAGLAERTQDLLVVRRGENLDYLEGVVEEMTQQAVGFRMNGEVVTGNRERMDGIVFYHAPGRLMAKEICEIVTTGSSRLLAQHLKLTEATVSIVMACGATLELDRQAVVELDFTSGRTVYLSDMTPTTIQWTPLIADPQLGEYLQVLNRPRMDQSFTGEPLRLAVSNKTVSDTTPVGASTQLQTFDHGMAVKGGTRIVFPLAERFSRLTGVVGFAPNASLDGKVELIILSDAEERFRQVLENQTPHPLTIDLSVDKTRRLTLSVEYFDGRSVGDIIHFGDLKVSK